MYRLVINIQKIHTIIFILKNLPEKEHHAINNLPNTLKEFPIKIMLQVFLDKFEIYSSVDFLIYIHDMNFRTILD